MTFKFEEDRIVIDLRSDVMDKFVLAGLQEARGVVIECIDGDIERCNDGVIEEHIWNNLQENFRFLRAFDTIIEYYGG